MGIFKWALVLFGSLTLGLVVASVALVGRFVVRGRRGFAAIGR